VKAFLDTGAGVCGDLFLQTKFTFAHDQDHRLPYDNNASLAAQVAQSCASSLAHLNTNYIDSYILHGTFTRHGIVEEDFITWQAMEGLVAVGQVRYLGISNVSVVQLRDLCASVRVKPHFVQNLPLRHSGWNEAVQSFCLEEGMLYQGFGLLLAPEKALANFGKHLPAATKPRNIAELTELCQSQFPELKDWRKICFRYGEIGIKTNAFHKAHKTSSIVRNAGIEAEIFAAMAKGERVMVMAGLNHLGGTVSSVLTKLAAVE
jgi:Aldo/keto reductase family